MGNSSKLLFHKLIIDKISAYQQKLNCYEKKTAYTDTDYLITTVIILTLYNSF